MKFADKKGSLLISLFVKMNMKMKLFKSVMLLSCICFATLACNSDSQEEKDEKKINDYLEENNLDAESTESGLHYIINVPGNNEHPEQTDQVRIAYVGTLLNGNLFDSSTSSTFPLNQLIAGLREGIPLLGKGGEGTFILPSELGYGDSNSNPSIPANSVLIFEVTLIDF